MASDSLASEETPSRGRVRRILFQSIALACTALILCLNYFRARIWAGQFTAEATGYMFGGVMVCFLLGFLGMYIVRKVRGEKIEADAKMLGVAGIALVFSLFLLLGAVANSRPPTESEVNRELGHLLKQAAGAEPLSRDTKWWESPARDMFRDFIERNQQYIAEVKGLENSAIKDLYSAASYSDKARMEKTVTQLQAIQTVEQKYASLDPVFEKMRERVGAAHATAKEKQDLLAGMNAKMEEELAPRREVLRVEGVWLSRTIELYQFAMLHFSEYSVKGGKVYFRKDETRETFVTQQHEAVAGHQEFLKAKKAFDDSRTSKLDQLGVSASDFKPEQLGKTK